MGGVVGDAQELVGGWRGMESGLGCAVGLEEGSAEAGMEDPEVFGELGEFGLKRGGCREVVGKRFVFERGGTEEGVDLRSEGGVVRKLDDEGLDLAKS